MSILEDTLDDIGVEAYLDLDDDEQVHVAITFNECGKQVTIMDCETVDPNSPYKDVVEWMLHKRLPVWSALEEEIASQLEANRGHNEGNGEGYMGVGVL